MSARTFSTSSPKYLPFVRRAPDGHVRNQHTGAFDISAIQRRQDFAGDAGVEDVEDHKQRSLVASAHGLDAISDIPALIACCFTNQHRVSRESIERTVEIAADQLAANAFSSVKIATQ